MGKTNRNSATILWNFCLLSVFSISLTCGQYYWSAYSAPKWVNRQSQEAELQCPEPSGQFNHPKYCDLFLNCWAGIPTVGRCQAGLVFNEKIKGCDYTRNVNCQGRGNSQDPTSPSTFPTVTEAPSTELEPPRPTAGKPARPPRPIPILTMEPPTAEPSTTDEPTSSSPQQPTDPRCEEPYGAFPNPINCSEYFVCNDGRATVYVCPEKMYYNKYLGSCSNERPSYCPEDSDNDLTPSGPVSAGTPTLAPIRPQAPFSPKPPFVPEPTPAAIPDPSVPQNQEEDVTTGRPPPTEKPTPITVTDLKPKPPLRPEGTIPDGEQTSKPPIDLGNIKPKPVFKPSEPGSGSPPIPDTIEPTRPPPTLNPGAFKPQKPPGGPPTTVAPTAPVDGEDDPNILFPFLPSFPGNFKCPISTGILPVVGDCESVVVCVGGVGHHFRCPHGHNYDALRGMCSSERNFICPSTSHRFVENQALKESPKIIYSYLPSSHLHKHLGLRVLPALPAPKLVNWFYQK